MAIPSLSSSALNHTSLPSIDSTSGISAARHTNIRRFSLQPLDIILLLNLMQVYGNWKQWVLIVGFMMFNATFNYISKISWRGVNCSCTSRDDVFKIKYVTSVLFI